MKDTRLILEILPRKNGHTYPFFRVYVPTSAPDGLHYVRYNFNYEYNDERQNFAPNSTANVSNYRIREAELVRVLGLNDASVMQDAVLPVLQAGEISLAIREELHDTAHLMPDALPKGREGEYIAADFIGGYHGDERLTEVSLSADDMALDLSAAPPSARYVKKLRFFQRTTLYRWGTSAKDHFGMPVAEHEQALTVTADGIRHKQELTWLRDDFHIRRGNCYLQMFTMRRETKAGAPVCERFEAFDENGNSLGGEALQLPVAASHVHSFGNAARTVRYSSATTGVCAEVGFQPLDNTLAVDVTNVHVRVPMGDNKWYAAFCSAENGRSPARGERFALMLHYHIDYTGKNA